MIFLDFTKNNGFQNIKIKLNSTTWMALECSVVIFQALEYLWSQWPQQPQQPQWPQWPQQPHFTDEITEFYDSINHGTKNTFPGLSMWNESSKIHYFMDFWHFFCWRLWRPYMLLLTKSMGHKSKFRISWMYRSSFYDLKVYFWWPNKRFFWLKSSLNTLYFTPNCSSTRRLWSFQLN